jgi:hypothetical protein
MVAFKTLVTAVLWENFMPGHLNSFYFVKFASEEHYFSITRGF